MQVRSAVVYTVLRLAAFLVPFGLMMLLPIMREQYLLSAVFAALIGLALSMLFLRRPLEDMSAGIARSRRPRTTDEDVEDAATQVPRDQAQAQQNEAQAQRDGA